MLHPCIVETMNTLDQLRRATIGGKAGESAHLSYNVYFCWDQQGADVDIALSSQPGHLLTADIALRGTPEWFTLSIGLGSGTFGVGDTLGLAVDLSATAAFDLAPFIRSVDGGKRHDTHLADAARIGNGTVGPALLLHTVDAHEPLAWAGSFHTLIIPLPRQSGKLELRDMRLFHAPAQKGLRLRPRTLASAAY